MRGSDAVVQLERRNGRPRAAWARLSDPGNPKARPLAGARPPLSIDTHGHVGPDFNTSEQLSRDQIRTELDYGDGVMPSYGDRLNAGEREAVIEFGFRTLQQRR